MSATVDLKLVSGVRTPDSSDPECALLGGILLDQETIWQVCHLITGADFARAAHGHIYDAMLALAQRGDSIDFVLLRTELEARGRFHEAGGLGYLAMLDTCVPASPNAARYARTIADRSALRRVKQAALATIEDVHKGEGSPDAIIDRAGRRMLDATQRETADAPVELGTLLRTVFSTLEQRHEQQTRVTGLSTGLADLDDKTTGMHPGELIVVAGRPGMGKTGIAMGFAEVAAIDQGLPTIVFSLEMPKEQLVERMIARRARVDSGRVRTGMFERADWARMARAADEMFRAPLEILDTAGIGILRVRQECRKFKARRGKLGLVVVDYLQLMVGENDDNNREREIAKISAGLKELAKEMSCPVVALAQLNRGLERREDRRPVMSDLRESGAIEQDADVIFFLYRDEEYNKETPDKGTAEVIIGKQRNGPKGTVKVAFQGEYTRFDNLAPGRWS